MRLLRSFQRAVATLLNRTRFERDMRAEIQEHIDSRATDLAKSGLSAADALRQARVEFGAMETYKEQCRDAGGLARVRPFLGILSDLRLGARRLLATPLFLTFAVVSLAVGVSVTTTVYSVLYSLLWKPLGVHEPSTVAVVTIGRGQFRNALSAPDFEDLRGRQQSFSDLAAAMVIGLPVETPNSSELAPIEAVTDNYFRTLGIDLVLGRPLGAGDERGHVTVLSERHWRKQFDGDPAIVGKTIRLSGQPFEIVGVASERFTGLQSLGARELVAWVPLESGAKLVPGSRTVADPRDWRSLTVVGRLAAGGSVRAAASELGAVSSSLDNSHPIRIFRAGDGALVPTRRQWSASDATSATQPGTSLAIDSLLLGMTALVLLVACTNLANLMLSRGALRLHEFAVRRALGASRWRLVREFLAESVWITLLGAIGTFILTRWLLWMTTIDIPMGHGVFTLEPELNRSALLFTSVALVVSALVFGFEPALNLTRSTLGHKLESEAGAGPLTSGRRQRSLIRWQVAISTCFFIVTAVLAKVVVADARNDTGIALDRLAVTTLHFGIQGWDESRARHVVERALEIARRDPEIASASVASGLPFGMMMQSTDITTSDRPFVNGTRAIRSIVLAGSPELLRTLQVPLIAGRDLDVRDDAGSRRVAVASEFTARRLFGTTDVVGREIVIRDSEKKEPLTLTVVGVARQTDVDTVMSRDDHLIYVPYAQRYLPNVALVARTINSPSAGARILQAAVREADPELASGTSGPAYWLVAGPYIAARITAALAAALGALTLILAMVGLYGVQAQAVAHRTREVGVRMALGADAEQIERMVLREGFSPVVQGLLIGLVLGTLGRGAAAALLSARLDILDPLAFALVPVPLAIAAFLACYLPARRAASVDPNVALRHL